MSAATSAKPFPKAQNDRVQDLFLLAKGLYRLEAGRLPEAARRVVAFHNLYTIERMSTKDAAWVVCNDLLPLVLTQIGHRGWPAFLVSLGPQNRPFAALLDSDSTDYYERLIDAVLEQVRSMRVREADKWLLPFPQPELDPFIVQLLATTDPTALQLRR